MDTNGREFQSPIPIRVHWRSFAVARNAANLRVTNQTLVSGIEHGFLTLRATLLGGGGVACARLKAEPQSA